jgi:outer membrane receptor protein involved in Fe transport
MRQESKAASPRRDRDPHHWRAVGVTMLTMLVAGSGWAADESEVLTEIVVTGSRLSSPNETSPSPITVVDAEELRHQGTARAEDLLNSLPQLNSGLTLGANGAGVAPLTGTATADLRGIGAFRTLVLVNGLRTAPGDPTNPSTDLNTVPTALVKRVEVLTGGASAIYGSDAIAGVVNFILDTEFTGARFDIEGGFNHGSNNHTDLQAIQRVSGITPPSGGVNDGQSLDFSGIFGRDLPGGKGHVTAYAGYRHVAAVTGASRDFSNCLLRESGTSFQCALDGTTPAGQFVSNGGNGANLTLDSANGHAFRPFDPIADGYNAAPLQDLQRPDTRYNAGLFASYQIGESANLYAEAQYTDDKTNVRYEPAGTTPTGSGLNVFGVNCNNPLLSASQVNDLCTLYGLGPLDTAQVAIGRRNVEGGLRSDEFHHHSFRLVAGLKGAINESWTYDTSAVYGKVGAHEKLTNDLSQSRLANALNVVGVGGVPTCQSVVDGTDPGCIPYNIYATGGVTPAALGYITEGGRQSGYADRAILSGQLLGKLSKYGFKSPYASDGIGVAIGAEYRTESVDYRPDLAYSSGDLLVTGGARPTVGSFHVAEVFTELKVPLVDDHPGLQRLAMNLSDRFARYTPQGNVNALGVGLEWAPVKPLRLRASFNRAIRAPNIHELFLANVLTQVQAVDPCANDPTTGVPMASAAQCAHSGVTAAQYGTIPGASNINQLIGGNRQSKPETADTVTMGLVFAPHHNLLVSVDYWRIKVSQYLGYQPPQYTLTNCLNSGNPVFCSLVQRDANGSLSTGNGAAAGRVIASGINTGSYGNSGVDIDGRYRINKLTFDFVGSAALRNPIAVAPGSALIDCTGYFGPNCTGLGPTSPVPRWRHRLRTTWQLTSAMQVSLNWRHIGPLNSELASSYPALANTVYPVDAHIGAHEYFDLDGSIDLSEHLDARIGINNLLDRSPPVIGTAANPLLVNGNMAAGMYDTLGRYIFVGLSAKY